MKVGGTSRLVNLQKVPLTKLEFHIEEHLVPSCRRELDAIIALGIAGCHGSPKWNCQRTLVNLKSLGL
jgi:hypothetical protein